MTSSSRCSTSIVTDLYIVHFILKLPAYRYVNWLRSVNLFIKDDDDDDYDDYDDDDDYVRIGCVCILEPPTRHIIGHFGDDFYRPDDQTNSIKALKETSWSSKIRLESHQNHSTILQ